MNRLMKDLAMDRAHNPTSLQDRWEVEDDDDANEEAGGVNIMHQGG